MAAKLSPNIPDNSVYKGHTQFRSDIVGRGVIPSTAGVGRKKVTEGRRPNVAGVQTSGHGKRGYKHPVKKTPTTKGHASQRGSFKGASKSHNPY